MVMKTPHLLQQQLLLLLQAKLLQLLHQLQAVLLRLLLLLRLVRLLLLQQLQHLQEMLLQQLLLLHQHPSTLALLQLQLPLQDEAEIRLPKLCQPNGQPMCCFFNLMKHIKRAALQDLAPLLMNNLESCVH